MTNRKKYLLVQDNSCHNYIIPEEKAGEWNEFCDIDEDDEASWDVPEWARGIDGTNSFSFFLD